MIIEFIKKHIIHGLLVIATALLAVLPLAVLVYLQKASLLISAPVSLLSGYFLYVFVIIWSFSKLVHLRENKKIKKRNEHLLLQFHFIQKQLDNHFTFNVLNSISASILRNNRTDANKQLTLFSKVLRYIFDDKKSLLHKLDNEIELTENYLILEKIRFKDKFEYAINIEGQINGFTQVPKQIIQISVDNAIRHGIMPLSEIGFLKVTINSEDEHIHITIEDNGIGRENASKMNTLEKKGHSIKLLYQIIHFLNDLDRKNQIHLKIFDLYKNGGAAGTRVEIWVPSGYAPKIQSSD